jgi:tetrapyrrole methylase family protein/MazG family protein
VGSLRPHITVVGLGPADGTYVSTAVLDLVANAKYCALRTKQHQAADDVGIVDSFDHFYETAKTFDEVYRQIVEELVRLAGAYAPDPIIYAVPGSPLVAERTVDLLRDDDRVEVSIVPALSFLDLCWDRLDIDPLSRAVRIIDAEQVAADPTALRGDLLVAQCWSETLISDIKLAFDTDDDVPPPSVTILHHLGLADEEVRTVDWWEMDRAISPDHLTSLYIPGVLFPANAEREMARLEQLVLTLRERCPWDGVQTHATLMPHLIEETYEVLDALSAVSPPTEAPTEKDFAHLEEELGDLLFQIVFHARLAQEEGQFTLASVARGIHDKLVHRHPHVFGDVNANTPDEVLGNWEAIKKEEKGRVSVTEGIPSHLPSLMMTTKLQRKARSIGLSLPAQDLDPSQLVRVLSQRATESQRDEADAPLALTVDGTVELVGQVLFEIADLARQMGIDPEQALRSRAMLLRDRIVAAEESMAQRK